ncbi:MAG: bifunctional diaminohydroxyphosphoribosylaminopyrimidine deaminase/5-amino-6-(5-phosphoribosylamino)uracil reductase RibD [Candidatus Poseidoniaceae archaeon]|jgi:diaminohydroxyphosphoribosylaminopyrimidine deaminase/5-amino-6-(5-phosphoribosylamino)uracil reductase|nr:bifunctional diaminohydroxyphosphoribosylaminopyrimidine deaminase/5-amino-6-(5-phosphoribosylamino)uracil reductase RibD [Candidatus Poseidoniaceae archaeon]
MAWSDAEHEYMRRAIEIAENGRGKVRPNPLVGCVLVKDGKIIAEGWHDHLGGLHAEQMSIHDAEENGHITNGAAAYVTLEPCNHFGRTPPCTEALLWAGISHVVIAHEDPNPIVRGNGISVLENAGITVETGLLKEEAAHQMREFLHWCGNRRPFVTVKVAIDANGSVDDLSTGPARFTSEDCLKKVHELRKDCCAILVGANTVIRDDPSLNVRLVESERQPLRVVIDPNNRISPSSKVLADGLETKHLTNDFRGLAAMLDMLGDLEIQRLLVEGGPDTINRFLSNDLVDEFILVQSNLTHNEPLRADFDLSKFSKMEQTYWGEESVKVYTR